jgi:hypothetical protein
LRGIFPAYIVPCPAVPRATAAPAWHPEDRDTASLRNILVFAVIPHCSDNGRRTSGLDVGREEMMRPSTGVLRELVRKRDFYAGGLMLLIGLFIALKGMTYRTGTLMHMGPGFLPTALGILLVLLGVAIAAASLSPAEEGHHEEDQRILPEHPQWWAWLCILMSPVFFIGLGYYFGMAPATFSCVFVAAMGDRNATWKSSVVLAAIITVFGVGLFSYFLQVPMPILTWKGAGL